MAVAGMAADTSTAADTTAVIRGTMAVIRDIMAVIRGTMAVIRDIMAVIQDTMVVTVTTIHTPFGMEILITRLNIIHTHKKTFPLRDVARFWKTGNGRIFPADENPKGGNYEKIGNYYFDCGSARATADGAG